MPTKRVRELLAKYAVLSSSRDDDGVEWVWGEPVHLPACAGDRECLRLFGSPEECDGYRVYRVTGEE